MKVLLKQSGIATRQQRRSVKGHPVLYPEWWLALASQYFDAYRSLPTPKQLFGPFWPRYFLLGHSVELVLKGFLGRKGVEATPFKRSRAWRSYFTLQSIGITLLAVR
jgi:hypothetical protein